MSQSQSPQQADMFELYRASLRTTSEMMKASLESAQRLQNQQLLAMESAMTLWASLCQMAGENQMAAIARMQSQMAQARDMLAGAASAGLKQPPREESRKAA